MKLYIAGLVVSLTACSSDGEKATTEGTGGAGNHGSGGFSASNAGGTRAATGGNGDGSSGASASGAGGRMSAGNGGMGGAAGEPAAAGGRMTSMTSITDGGGVPDASDSGTDTTGAGDAEFDAGAGLWTSMPGSYCVSPGLGAFLYQKKNSAGETFACTARNNVPSSLQIMFVQGECAESELCAPCYDINSRRTGVCPP